MNIERIADCNVVLGAPVGWDPEREGTEVVGLPVHRHKRGFVSQWRPSPQELEMLLNGHPIWLHVVGAGHPPVAVTVAPAASPIQENTDAV